MLYQVDAPTYEDGLAQRQPQLETASLVDLTAPGHDITPLQDAYR